jgi:acyl carrier protein
MRAMATIEQRVVKVLSKRFPHYTDEMTRETRLVEDVGADSVDAIELILDFEDEFEISVPDGIVENIQRVGDIVDYLEKLLADQQV